METKVGYAFSYRGSGYIYPTLKDCYDKIEQLKNRDRPTRFCNAYKWISVELARVTVDNKELISYEPLNSDSNFI